VKFNPKPEIIPPKSPRSPSGGREQEEQKKRGGWWGRGWSSTKGKGEDPERKKQWNAF